MDLWNLNKAHEILGNDVGTTQCTWRCSVAPWYFMTAQWPSSKCYDCTVVLNVLTAQGCLRWHCLRWKTSSEYFRKKYRVFNKNKRNVNVAHFFQAPLHVSDHQPSRDWPHSGGIRFDDYSTRYRPELDLVVKNVSVNIRGGEKVIVASLRSAPLKSTLFRNKYMLIYILLLR